MLRTVYLFHYQFSLFKHISSANISQNDNSRFSLLRFVSSRTFTKTSTKTSKSYKNAGKRVWSYAGRKKYNITRATKRKAELSFSQNIGLANLIFVKSSLFFFSLSLFVLLSAKCQVSRNFDDIPHFIRLNSALGEAIFFFFFESTPHSLCRFQHFSRPENERRQKKRKY